MILKILILANNDLGLYNFRKELIQKLINLGNDIYISLPNGPKIKELKQMGCKFIETDIDRRGTSVIKDFKLFIKYIRIIKSVSPQVILTYTIKPNIYGGIAAEFMNIKYIENITGLGTALESKGAVQIITKILYKIALRKAQCIFVQNSQNLQFMKKNIGYSSKYSLIPGSGVNLEKFKLLDYPNEEKKIIFLLISRIMKEKGIEQYLETAQYIKSKYENTEFHIVGFCEQEYEEKLRKFQEEGIVKYHGRQDNIIPYLEMASCLIHPSYYPEGMSNVCLEASAIGRPVITTNRSGCKETVEDGKTGYIVETKNLQQLEETTEKFLKLSNEQRKQMGLEARRKMEKEFDRNIVIEAYINNIK